MKVKLRNGGYDRHGKFCRAGSVADVDAKVGKHLLTTSQADPVEGKAPAQQTKVETAEAVAAPEEAVTVKGKRQKKQKP